MKKALIFDLGGVLIDYDGQATLQAVWKLCDCSLTRLETIVREVDRPFGLGQLNSAHLYAILQKQAGVTAPYQAVATAFCSRQQRNERGLAFARRLHEEPDVSIGIISNTNPIHAAWLYAHIPEFESFSPVLLSHEIGFLKPDPPIYRLALEEMGVPAENGLFVDDLVENVRGAQQLGLDGHQHRDWPGTETAVLAWLESKR